MPGVHSLDPAALIVPNLPEALELNREIFEKSERRKLRLTSRRAVDEAQTEIPLVSNSISSRSLPEYCFVPSETVTYYRVFASDVYICRHSPEIPPPESPNSTRSAVYEFTTKSKANLKHICDNSGHRVKSQLCLTYHAPFPTDGKASKRHLNRFLKVLNRRFPGLGYIWVLEFQERGAPHYHLFLTIEPNREIQEKLATAWVRITNGTPEQHEWHMRRATWKEWKMSSAYALKQYAVKAAQKDVPPEYVNVGRFWGNSQNMIPKCQVITPGQIASTSKGNNPVISWEPVAVERYVNRALRKLQEKQMNYEKDGTRRKDEKGKIRKKKKASFTRSEGTLNGGFKIRNGASSIMKLIHYMQFSVPDKWSLAAISRAKLPF
jgi:hypothetical protein